MIDICKEFEQWLQAEKGFALATVIRTWRSAPRPEGAAMAINEEGTMIGSVSGGCVEGAVIKEALQVISSKNPKRLSFGVSDEDAWSVGLSCGGQIDIWLEYVDSKNTIWQEWLKSVNSNQGCLMVTALNPSNDKALLVEGQLRGNLSDNLIEASKTAYLQHKTQILEDHFFNVFPAKSRMIIIGAAHVSLDLLNLAHLYHFETMVIDPRGIFTKGERFGQQPHQMFEDWPAEVLPDLRLDADTYVVVLTHDPKIDDQALQIVLNEPVAYVGALGSKKTHEKRKSRLKEAGLSEEQIALIHAPVGVAINARQPAEIALSIMAQIIQVRNQYL